MQVAGLSEYLATRRELVDSALERFLGEAGEFPAVVREAMRYSLLAGGKRLRPILVLAAAETVRGATPVEHVIELALPAACAIEFIHTYSLVHDDLPAMDDDSLRRGRPTNHVVYGEGMAILAGDGLLTEAFALMAREPRDRSLDAQKLRAIHVVAGAAGAAGMVGGQAIDLHAVGSASGFDATTLQDMHARKTGALIKASATAGAVMAGADDRTVLAVEEFGLQLGLAFQIVDDILDVEGTGGALGKTPGKDARAGKPTYPAVFGLEESRHLAAERHDAALQALTAAGLQHGRLADIASWVVKRTS